jgi:transposase InsO family protein
MGLGLHLCRDPGGLRLRRLCHRYLRPAHHLSIKYTERLAEAGIEPSVGSVGDSYDNALAETINGLYKAEVIHRRGPWRSFEAVEFATLEYIYTPPQCGRGAGHAWLMTPLSRSALISSGV